MPEDTAIQVATAAQLQAPTFAPRNLAEAMEFAKLISDSGMVPRDYINKPGAIVVAIQMGMEVGLLPIQALQSIAVINGRPGLWGDGALAIVKAHPDFVSIQEDDSETIKKNSKATCIIKRRGQPDVKATFSQEDAATAGLWKKIGPWTTAPFRMMQMRARGFAMRDQFPDALKGIKTIEELRDYPGETIEGTTQATPATETAKEETLGQSGGSDFYKIYSGNGWIGDDSRAWLRDNLQIGEPHNKKDSRDIPVSEWTAVSVGDRSGKSAAEIPGGRAWVWANTYAPIKQAVIEKFNQVGFTADERLEFFAKHKGPKKVEEFINVDKALAEEIAKRDATERGE